MNSDVPPGAMLQHVLEQASPDAGTLPVRPDEQHPQMVARHFDIADNRASIDRDPSPAHLGEPLADPFLGCEPAEGRAPVIAVTGRDACRERRLDQGCDLRQVRVCDAANLDIHSDRFAPWGQLDRKIFRVPVQDDKRGR